MVGGGMVFLQTLLHLNMETENFHAPGDRGGYT